MDIRSYSSIYALGHRYLESLFCEEVLIEEKVAEATQYQIVIIGSHAGATNLGKILN